MKQMSLRTVVIAASTFAAAGLLSFSWSEQGGISLSVESAHARVGRPLTPVSVAGVARRHNRRAAYGYGYGAGVVGAGVAGAAAVGTAAAVAATSPNWGWGTGPYYGGAARTGYYGDAYAAQNDPHYGQPHYVVRAYHGISPYYGYSGWDNYKTRNGIGCEPGGTVQLSDGLTHVCQ
jgi:hypothetical protein